MKFQTKLSHMNERYVCVIFILIIFFWIFVYVCVSVCFIYQNGLKEGEKKQMIIFLELEILPSFVLSGAGMIISD